MAFHISHIQIEIHYFFFLKLSFLLICLFLLMSPPFSKSPRFELSESSLIPDVVSVVNSHRFYFYSFSGRQLLRHSTVSGFHYFSGFCK